MKLKDYVKVIWNKTPIILREKEKGSDCILSKRLFEAYSNSPVFNFYGDREVLSVEASNNKIDIVVAK